MKKVEAGLVALIGIIHVYFLVLEMFLWTTPKGLETFNMTQEVADSSAVLAANQGLYNGFLAAGLFLSLFLKSTESALVLRRFVLGCIIVAGVYGAATVGIKILYIQATPAVIAFALGLFANRD